MILAWKVILCYEQKSYTSDLSRKQKKVNFHRFYRSRLKWLCGVHFCREKWLLSQFKYLAFPWCVKWDSKFGQKLHLYLLFYRNPFFFSTQLWVFSWGSARCWVIRALSLWRLRCLQSVTLSASGDGWSDGLECPEKVKLFSCTSGVFLEITFCSFQIRLELPSPFWLYPLAFFNCSVGVRTTFEPWQMNRLFQVDEPSVEGSVSSFPYSPKHIAFPLEEVAAYLDTARVLLCCSQRSGVSVHTWQLSPVDTWAPVHFRARGSLTNKEH